MIRDDAMMAMADMQIDGMPGSTWYCSVGVMKKTLVYIANNSTIIIIDGSIKYSTTAGEPTVREFMQYQF